MQIEESRNVSAPKQLIHGRSMLLLLLQNADAFRVVLLPARSDVRGRGRP